MQQPDPRDMEVTITMLSGESIRVIGLSPEQQLSVLVGKAGEALDLPGHLIARLCLGSREFGEKDLCESLAALAIANDSVLTCIASRPTQVFEYLEQKMETEMGLHFLKQKRLMLGCDGTCRLLVLVDTPVIKGFMQRTLALYHGSFDLEGSEDAVMSSGEVQRSV